MLSTTCTVARKTAAHAVIIISMCSRLLGYCATCCNVVLHPVNNVVLHPVNNCCQQLLSTTIVHSCSRSTIILQSLLTTLNKLFSLTIVSSCFNNIVTIIVLYQHRTTIDRTILINIVNLTSVV